MFRITICGDDSRESFVHVMKFSIFRENVDVGSWASASAYAPIESPGPLGVVLFRGWPKDEEK